MDPVTGTLLGIKITSDILGGLSQRKALKSRAGALRAQAERRLSKGKAEAASITTQGKLSQTQFATQALTSGAMTRENLAQDMTLEEIANRAKIEADIAMEDAQYEATMMREDASAYEKQAKGALFSSILGGIGDLAYFTKD